MTSMPRAAGLIAGLLTVAGVTACGDGSQLVVRPPATAVASSTPTSAPTTTAAIHPVVVVTPSRHLHDGEIVHVEARGFGPNQALVTIECVDVGKRTGQATCNVAGLSPIAVDASGTGSTDFTVHVGPFGSAGVSCTGRHPCIVSVSQATATPTQTASSRISFG